MHIDMILVIKITQIILHFPSNLLRSTDIPIGLGIHDSAKASAVMPVHRPTHHHLSVYKTKYVIKLFATCWPHLHFLSFFQ